MKSNQFLIVPQVNQTHTFEDLYDILILLPHVIQQYYLLKRILDRRHRLINLRRI